MLAKVLARSATNEVKSKSFGFSLIGTKIVSPGFTIIPSPLKRDTFLFYH